MHKKPDWFKIRLQTNEKYRTLKKVVQENKLHTICQSGNCPNQSECWNNGTATFMILGNMCTRNCRFCNVPFGRPTQKPDPLEPQKVADAIKLMNLKHCVITSVTRDDLQDGGATVWATTIQAIKSTTPQVTMEVLIPDMQGKRVNIDTIVDAKPDIIAHNMETVQRLTPFIRSRATYQRSLEVLEYLATREVSTKSGIMIGIGETPHEVLNTMDDLLQRGCRILTIGQYLQPTAKHVPVTEYIHPSRFAYYKRQALQRGFKHVESGPFVRSSYHAEKHV